MVDLVSPDVLVFLFVVALVLVVFGWVAWRRHFISSLKASVKVDLMRLVAKNQPREQPMDPVSVTCFSFYVPLIMVAFGGVEILSSETFMFGMAMYVALIISLLVIHHTAILQSFSAKTNVYSFLQTVTGWYFLQILKVFAKPIVVSKDLLKRVKAKSLVSSRKNKGLHSELVDFWRTDKFYVTVLQKFRNSFREASMVVTDLPWKEAIKEQPMEMDAGIRKITIPVGSLVLNYTSASEAMSSDEHKKYLGVDRVEIPVFTATTRFMNDDAHRALAAAALDEIRSPDYRVRMYNAEARANILQERNDKLMKDRKVERRDAENSEMGQGRRPEGKPKRRITKAEWSLIAIIISLMVIFALLMLWPQPVVPPVAE